MKARLRGIQTSIANRPSEYLLEVENQLRREYFDILQQEEYITTGGRILVHQV